MKESTRRPDSRSKLELPSECSRGSAAARRQVYEELFRLSKFFNYTSILPLRSYWMSLIERCNLRVNKLYNRILEDIGHVNLVSSLYDFWVFLHHQPTHVTKEKATISVVRIGIRFRKFVMHSVISDPIENRIL